MKQLGNKYEMQETAVKIQALCDKTFIPTSSWIMAQITMAETLALNDKIEDAL